MHSVSTTNMWSFCILFSSTDSVAKKVLKSRQHFDNVQMAVNFNQQNRGLDRIPSIAKKGLLGKKYRKHLLSSFPKTKLTQTNGSVFADRKEQVKKTKFEQELIKKCRLFSGWFC